MRDHSHLNEGKGIKNMNNLLEQAAHNLFLSIHNDKNQFVWATERVIEICGFSDLSDIIGHDNSEVKCKAAEKADLYDLQNKMVLKSQKRTKFLGLDGPYANGETYVFIYDRFPIVYNDKQHICVSAMDVTNQANLFALTKLINEDKQYYQNHANYCLDPDPIHCQLTNREMEILFYILRRKSAKEIGKILSISFRTVEFHRDNIKNKFNVDSQAQLVDAAINNGFLQYIPKSYVSQLCLHNG